MKTEKQIVLRKKFKHLAPFLKPVLSFIRKIYYPQWNKRKKKFGIENPEYTFYIIRRKDDKAGLFSVILVFLEHINYALKKGYVPIIDMKNYSNMYLDDDKKGKCNAWEYYFLQPNNYSFGLEDAYKSKKVILSNGFSVKKEKIEASINFLNTDIFAKYRRIYKESIHINDQIYDYLNQEKKKLFGKKKNILGVFCRGTDYTTLKPFGHPIQPEIDKIFNKVNELKNKWKCENIYLCTEDTNIIKEFKIKYKDSVIITDRSFINYNEKKLLADYSLERENDKYYQGLDYLTQIYILSQCDYLLAGLASGSVAVLLMENNFKDKYIWDLGFYGIDEK